MNTSKNSNLYPLIAWILLVIISVLYLWGNLQVVSNMGQFMPSSYNDKRLSLLIHETEKGTVSSLLFVELSGTDPDYLAILSRKVKQQLEITQEDHEPLTVLNGDPRGLNSLFKDLMAYRYLLHKPGSFSEETLKNSFVDIESLIRTGISDDVVKYLLADPQKQFVKYISSLDSQVNINKYNGVWFSSDRKNALLMVEPKTTGLDLDQQEKTINLIFSTVAKSDVRGIVKVDVVGPGAIAVATRTAMKKTTTMVSWILTIFIFVIFWFAYCSIKLAFIAAIPLVTSILVAMVVAQSIFHEIHGIVLAFGVTLLGVSLDYPLHLFSHLAPKESSRETLDHIWPTLKLGALTSIAAFIGLIGTGFDGLNQLAVFAASGLITALLVTRWIVPLLIDSTNLYKVKVPVLTTFNYKVKIGVTLLVVVIPMVVLLLSGHIWSTSMKDISPVSDSARLKDQQFRQALSAPDFSHLFFIEAQTVQQALLRSSDIKKQLETGVKSGVIKSITVASDILPPRELQKAYQQMLPGRKELQSNILAATSESLIRKDLFDNFANTVEKSKSLKTIGYQDIVNTPMGSRLRSLLFKEDKKWVSIVRVSGITDEARFKEWLARNPRLASLHISITELSNQLMGQYLSVAKERLIWVVSLVILLVLWQSKKRAGSLWVIVPVISALLLTTAVQVLSGNAINLFHLLSLLLVIGMGLDYSLFFNRDWQDMSELQARIHAMIVSVATTIVAFGVLGMSDIPILAAIGQTVAFGILISFLVAQVVAIPANKR